MKKTALRLVSLLTPLFVTATAFAQDAAGGVDKSALAYAAGASIGIAAFGGSLGQGKAAAAALEGIARNPNASDKLFTPMILGLALIESLVIYALVIAYLLQDKI
jgi:F-type H+-transporting ATPase subunit c